MSKRPVFWIHRTWRFWFGIAFLVTLTAMVLITGTHRSELTWGPRYKRLGAKTRNTSHTVSFQDSGLLLKRSVYIIHIPRFSSPSEGLSMSANKRYGFEWKPKASHWQDQRGNKRSSLFIPGWPFVVVAAFLWPLWMHWAEKRELARLRRVNPSAAGP